VRTPPPPLSPTDLQRRLVALPGWQVGDGTIERTWDFADFRAAFAFMTRVAVDAEALDHHPDWSNVYRRVTIRLSTHEAGNRVTERDLELAARIDRHAAAELAG
jgi:4a-hydroxytetrahydrobiopterin dehydratase